MSAEISKGKATSPPAAVVTDSSKKYLKKAELEAQRQQVYLEEQAAIQREREAKIAKKRKLDDEQAARNAERDEKRRRLAEESQARREDEDARKDKARRKRLGLPDLPDKVDDPAEAPSNPETALSPAELILALRALSHPATLFGETQAQRLSRYRTLTTPTASTPSLSATPIPTTLTLLPEAEMKVPSTIPTTPEGLTHLHRQLASYFTMVLTAWSTALSARPLPTKESTAGRAALATYTHTLSALTPLFRKLESADLPPDLLTPIVSIVRAAQERRYVDANDGYLMLSIGKAAWPIGVTMVGIHERSAREKLNEGEKGGGHIMSDEGTRKWLQSLKRCLSFAQTRWPPEDVMQLMG
ncbi:mRNA splicing protein prp18 [Puttea exsequens]|nr:mRNA splicing protein prp18 [Puttea exsequens]